MENGRQIADPGSTAPGDGRYRSWVVVSYEAAWDSTQDAWREKFLGLPNRRYAISGNELCPDTGRRHCQSYIQFGEGVSFDRLRGLLPRTNLRVARGTGFQNREYCSKDGDFVEAGVEPVQNNRSDLHEITKQVADGKSFRYMLTDPEGCMYSRPHQIQTAERIAKYVRKRKRCIPETRWFHGVTGAGKTHAIKQAITTMGGDPYGDDCYWWNGSKWWDGYDGERHVVMDELRGNKSGIGIEILIRILDGNPLYLDQKGAGTGFSATHIWITSPDPPELVYDYEDGQQLRRRCLDTKHFAEAYIAP